MLQELSETSQHWDSQSNSCDCERRKAGETDVSTQSDSKLQNNPTPDLSKRISTVITTEESLLSLSSLAILYKTNIPISFRAVIWSVCQDWLFYSLSKPRSPLSTSPHSSWSTVLLSLFCWSCACFCKVVTGEGT